MNATMLLAIGTGGAVGSLCRYLLAGAIGNAAGGEWPWGTLAVNAIGGLAIGVLAEGFAPRLEASPELRGFLVTGILGGFTTFSAFSLETMEMLERQAWGPAARLCRGLGRREPARRLRRGLVRAPRHLIARASPLGHGPC